MKNIIKRTELPINSHVIREEKVAYAIFTGYNEYYRAMVAGLWSGRVVKIVSDNIDQWSDEKILDTASSNGLEFESNKNFKVIRKGHKVE